MRVAILSCADLSRAQYIYKYFSLLDIYGWEYDVIYWNRTLDNNEIECKGNFISYDKAIDSYKPLYKKIFSYMGFAKFVRKTIKKNKYDKLIVLTTPMAICIFELCLGKYRKKYLFDYRDLTKEYIPIYKKLVQMLVKNSGMFVASSPGYFRYVICDENQKKVLCHNTFFDIKFKKELDLSRNGKIRVAYWGAVRQFEYNKRVCDLFGNDERFIFTYHGDGCYLELQEYCNKRGYENIFFTGRYCLEDIGNFAKNTDILFNAYELDFVTKPSLAVKVYDSIEYKLPMLVSKGAYMDEYLAKYKYVCSFEFANKILDDIYDWYMTLNEDEINEEFDKVIKNIIEDEELFNKEIYKFIGGK